MDRRRGSLERFSARKRRDLRESRAASLRATGSADAFSADIEGVDGRREREAVRGRREDV